MKTNGWHFYSLVLIPIVINDFFFQNALSEKTWKAEPLFIWLEVTSPLGEEKPKARGVQ